MLGGQRRVEAVVAVVHQFLPDGTLVAVVYPRFLFRYLRDDEHLEETLTAPYLWFSSLDSFNDPLEYGNRFARSEWDEIAWWLGTYAPQVDVPFARIADEPRLRDELSAVFDRLMESIFEAKLRQVGVCCCADSGEIPLLWAHYAQGHRGVCVVLRTSSVVGDGAIAVLAVEYVADIVRWNHPLERKNFGSSHRFEIRYDQAMFATKTPDWQYEREHRLYAHLFGRVDVPDSALAGVILGSRMDPDRCDELTTLLRQRYSASAVPVVRASLDRRVGTIWPTGFDAVQVASPASLRRFPGELPWRPPKDPDPTRPAT